MWLSGTASNSEESEEELLKQKLPCCKHEGAVVLKSPRWNKWTLFVQTDDRGIPCALSDTQNRQTLSADVKK